MTLQLFANELSKHIDNVLIGELIDEFRKTKSSWWFGDVIKTILHGGRFSEICIVCLKKISDQHSNIDINNIKFGEYYKQLTELTKKTPKEELLFSVIPHVLKSIYTIRSKKRVAHIKLNNADEIDAEYVITSCNWIMCQFILLYYSKDIEKAINLTSSIMEKKIPIIEQFEDGELMILKKNLTFGEELLLVLYQFPRRISTGELNRLLKPKKPSYVNTYLRELYKKKLIHLNKNGAIINKNGILYIESNKEKYFQF